MDASKVIALTGNPAFAVDWQGRIRAWNRAAERRFGYRRQEVLGRLCYEVLQGEDFSGESYCDESCPLRELAVLGGPLKPEEVCFRTRDGGKQPVRLLTLTPGGGQPGQAIVHLIQCLDRTASGDPEGHRFTDT